MITADNITRKQAKRLVKLVERETRCEIMARFGRFDNLGYADYAMKQIEYRDEMRKLLFGTDNMVELGYKWDMLNKSRKLKQKQKRKRKKT